MDAGPEHSYQHDTKNAILLVAEDNQARMLQTYMPVHWTFIG
jgi:hypothetical protein